MARRQRRSHEDFAAEIQAHLTLETDRLIQEGMSPDEARSAAERRFGNVARVQERFYESGRWIWKDQLVQDFRGAFRAMVKYPVACIVAVVSLAAGIGAATLTLTLRDTIFYNPPPLYQDPDRLSLARVATPGRSRGPAPGGLFQAWMDALQADAALAGATRAIFRDVQLPDRTETLPVRQATANLFAVLGVNPSLGRGLDAPPAERNRRTPAAVLSYRHWRRFFEGRPDAIGATILIDGTPHVIAGVMPARFWFVSDQPPIWTLLDVPRLGHDAPVDVVVRRAPGTSEAALQEQLQAAAGTFIDTRPPDQRQLRIQALGIGGTPFGNNVPTTAVVLVAAAVALTLLIACTNVAILMIAQWTTREHEIAIRASLGGSRWRLVRALVTESMSIAALGGALGVLFTLALRAFLVRFDGDGEALYDFSIKPLVMIKITAIVAMAGLLTGLAPALYETRRLQRNPLPLMRTNDRVRQRWRHALVAFEVAVTVGVLVVTGAVLSAYARSTVRNFGFDTQPLFRIHLEHTDGVAMSDTLTRLRAFPGVVAAAAASALPLTVSGPQQRLSLDAPGSGSTSAEAVRIGSEFFQTLGATMLSGRDFTSGERSTDTPVVIVNDALAKLFWPEAYPMGATLHIEGVAHEVVGVVAGYANSQLRPVKPMFFQPLADERTGPTRVPFLVRAAGDPQALTDAIRREVRDLRQGNVVTMVTTFDQILDVGGQEILILTYPLAPLIAIGLLLTAAGIYGVLAFAVARRANELAVRIAVGANRSTLVRLMVLHSLRLVAIGLAGGIGATFALTRVAQGSGGIFDSPGWQAFLVPVGIVVAIGLLATWVPSRRAMRIDPATLLRST